MLKNSKNYSKMLLSFLFLVSWRTVQLSEQEKAVKFFPPTRTVTLSLNDYCKMKGIERGEIAYNAVFFDSNQEVVSRKMAVFRDSNFVQLFPAGYAFIQSSNGSHAVYAAPLFRFWHCDSIPDPIKNRVMDVPRFNRTYSYYESYSTD